MAPRLKLIESTAGGPPRPLGQHGMALWRSIQDEYEITDAAGVELLTLACQALDRAESCRKQIDEDGELGQDQRRSRQGASVVAPRDRQQVFRRENLREVGLEQRAS
jgi:hypothetical protein